MDTTPPAADSPPAEDAHERLWTPWRMRYVGGGAKEEGCVFCSRLAAADDVESLILHRGEQAFVIMNLYPYNTGHVMLVPNAHVASPEALDTATAGELAALAGPTLRALRRALGCHGFNLGINVGAVAGAGVADHLHQHVVPRWQGDANFMPILAATMVLPELIPVTYAKLRAELTRELTGDRSVTWLLLDGAARRVLTGADCGLPRTTANDEEAVWQAAALAATSAAGAQPELLGWAGDARAGQPALVALAMHIPPEAGADPRPGWRWTPVEQVTGQDESVLARTRLLLSSEGTPQ